MVNRKRQWLASALVIAGLLTSLSVVGPARRANAASAVTLKLFDFYGEPNFTFMNNAIKEFERTHPGITIVQSAVAGTGAATYPDALRTSIAGGKAPDIFTEWTGSQTAPFITDQQVLDLTPYYKHYDWRKIFVPTALTAITEHGKVYGVPITSDGMGLWYRKDIFAKYGLHLPQTYAQLEHICQVLKAHSIYCVATAGKYGWMLMRMFDYFLEVTAGPALHIQLQHLQVSWNRPEVVAAYALLKKWTDNNWFPPGYLAVSPNDSDMAMYQGKAAMVLEGDWLEGALKAAKLNTSLYDFFVPPTNHTPVLFSAFPTQMMVTKTTAHPDQVLQFLNWWVQPATQQKYFAVTSSTATVGVAPVQAQWPFTYRWRKLIETSQTYLPSDQVFAPELMNNSFFKAQAGVASGQLTPGGAAQQMGQAIQAWQATNS